MQKAIDQLRDSNGLMLDEKVHITASYDGAYQKRSSKIGGGFSRFCFVSLIDMSTGKVVCYDVAISSQNIYKPKCLQPKRLQTETSTNQNVYIPKRLRFNHQYMIHNFSFDLCNFL